MEAEKFSFMSQPFMVSALQELIDEWQSINELSFNYNTAETLVWCGVADRQLEQLVGPGDIPCGTRFYYRKIQE